VQKSHQFQLKYAIYRFQANIANYTTIVNGLSNYEFKSNKK